MLIDPPWTEVAEDGGFGGPADPDDEVDFEWPDDPDDFFVDRSTGLDLLVIEAALDVVECVQATVQIDGSDADQTLSRVAAVQRRTNLADAETLALAAHWADLHAVLDFPTVGRRGAEKMVHPGGDGTPQVPRSLPGRASASRGWPEPHFR